MTNTNFYIRIFNPIFTYDRATEHSHSWKELQSFLLLSRVQDNAPNPNYTFPLHTAYYSYCSNIAILAECDGVYYCQTVIDGKPAKIYDVLKETDALREFFENCGKDLTVLENNRAYAFLPEFKTVLLYVKNIAKARKISDEHKSTLKTFSERLTEIQESCNEFKDSPPKLTYERALKLADQYLVTLNAVSEQMISEALRYSRKCRLHDEYNNERIFGLFIYALQLGLNRDRFLHRNQKIIQSAFSEMLREMHMFMEINPNIEESYCRYMNLHANDRARLKALLEKEGLYDKNWGYIGDDLF